MDLAIIGGTGLYDPGMLDEPRAIVASTPYGTASLHVGRHAGREVAFLPRHGAEHGVPPHRVNYRANIWALRQVGARRIIATAAVGSLRRELGPGSIVLVDQFLDFTKSRPSTFYDSSVRHTDMTEPYCPGLRALLARAADRTGAPATASGTYVCTEGPRFETPAEIRMFAAMGGDVVGMTGVPEVVLAHEAGLHYATIAIVTNFAAGISPQPLTHEEVVAVMAENSERLRAMTLDVVEHVGEAGACRCEGPAG
ncbi:MAG TPA: S-methyl-5'-thioadenosine phosphorylase [Bacillota bacterium]|nr:S-methyl-5'-thioadenosine phosphorylase [Bacillota bacterium]